MLRCFVWSFLLLACGSTSFSAPQMTVYEVLQPVSSDRGYVAGSFSHGAYENTFDDPTLLVRLTAAESRQGGPNGLRNLNEAHRAGIQIHAVLSRPNIYPGLSGDTLKVVLDLWRHSSEDSGKRDELVAVTVKCMEENASRARQHPIRFLKITVSGDPAFAHHAGLYALED